MRKPFEPKEKKIYRLKQKPVMVWIDPINGSHYHKRSIMLKNGHGKYYFMSKERYKLVELNSIKNKKNSFGDKWTPCLLCYPNNLKRTPIRKISKKKQRQLLKERPLRKEIIGDGICSKCGRKTETHPHEIISRGQGGKLSQTNSINLCNECHRIAQGNTLGLKIVKIETDEPYKGI